MIDILTTEAIALLIDLIGIESFSKNENKTAERIESWFNEKNIPFKRINNNIWGLNKYYNENKPTLLLNSHHDTVRPNSGYTKDPFKAEIDNDKLFGLGSNDAGGALVSLLALFAFYYDKKNLKYNLLIAATAEEEIAGKNSLKGLLKYLPKIDIAIIGEPTEMQMAIAEKGLIVFDGVITGSASHAAHLNNDNAIMKLPSVLKWFENFKFKKDSNLLGPVKITVTQLEAGKEHNVIPGEVNLVLDVRVNDKYKNKEIADIIINKAPCKLTPRSLRLESSYINKNHELVISGIKIGRKTYGSPTLSDQAALECPSLKMGPGLSTRSHTANEFIYLSEIKEAIKIYIKLLDNII
jgi:acetylornithine deacetylase